MNRTKFRLDDHLNNGKANAWAWPGGYPLFYVCADSGTLCPACVSDNLELIRQAPEYLDEQWDVVGVDINWEDSTMQCDHCNKKIESAYGEE